MSIALSSFHQFSQAGQFKSMTKPFLIRAFFSACIGLLLAVSPVLLGATISDQPYRQDQILIQPKAGVSGGALAAFHLAQGAGVRQTFAGLRGVEVVTVPAGDTVPGLIAKYQQSGLVTYAEPDYFGHLFSASPNDPKYLDGTLWGLSIIDAPDGWNVLNSASNIVVAVVDTGVRYTHEDLAANMWINPDDGSHGWNALTQTSDPFDDAGHGTLVAGVLGAVGNNGKGVTGVAWRVRIMACKCFNNLSLGTVSDAIACLEYARTNGARIINASWGFTNSLALSNAVVSLRDAGIILVAACGNGATNIDLAPIYPASYPLDNIVSVASITRSNTLAASSNFGANDVDLAAPGENIYSTFAATDNFYLTQSGTSLAAPYVAGALALMLAKYPTENYQQIIQRLLNATDPLPALAGKCVTGGRLNLAKALIPLIWLTPVATSSSNKFQLRLLTGASRECVIQMSANLSEWTPVYTNTTSTNGTFDFTNNIGSPAQFFRAVAMP